MPKLTYERAKEAIHYDPDTGQLTWLLNEGKRRAGKEAGGSLMKGYKRLRIDKEQYAHHQVAWLLMTGEWPEGRLDHRNRIRTDNRWDNLRRSTASQNIANCIRSADRGLPKGVHRHRDRYVASGSKGRKTHYLGIFTTPEEAHEAYVAFTIAAHGKYACVSHEDTPQAAENRAKSQIKSEISVPARPRGPASKSGLPRGVAKAYHRYRATGWKGGRKFHLGFHDTPEEAHAAYAAFYEAAFGAAPSTDPGAAKDLQIIE